MRKIGIIFGMLLIAAFSLEAGVTGKLAGRVLDRQTREPLAGVNVVIEETELGAATDPSGNYFILNVPPGTYSVTATMIGYEPLTKAGVSVTVDLTTTVNFELRPTVIPVEAVTVTAERPMVLRDATATTHVVTGTTIDRQPVQRFQDVVAIQAGVVDSPGGNQGATGGLHLRGGRADEVAYVVDGMSIRDPITGTAGADLIPTAIVEMAVVTGAFNAEYGQAMSGAVNVVTKEAREFGGLTRYTSDLPFSGQLKEGSHRAELNLGGPLPFYDRISYFLAGELSLRNQVQACWRDTIAPMSNTDREFYALQGKFTHRISPVMKLNLSGFYSRTQNGGYAYFVGLPGLDQHTENDYKYVSPGWRRADLRKAYQVTSAFTHQLGKSTFYDLRLGYFSTHTTSGCRDMDYEQERGWWQDMKIKPWWLYAYGDYLDEEGIDWAAKDEDGNYYYPYGVPGIFRLGPAGYWEDRVSDYYGATYTITSQITPHHQLKLGLDGKRYHITRGQGQYIYTIPSVDSITPDGDTIKVIDPKYRELKYALYFDEYDEDPMEAAAYLQDKIEYESFVITPGLRVDYLDPATWRYLDPLKPYKSVQTDTGLVYVPDTVSAQSKYQISPRFGIAFPVSAQTVFHVSYGHFFQMPRIRWMYDSYSTFLPTAIGAWTLVGNPDMVAQRTIQYEIGLGQQVTRDMALNLTAFYKDLYNLVGTRIVPAFPIGYTAYQTEDYGNVRGVEVVLQRRAGQWLSGQLAYTLQFAKGTSSYEREAYYDYIANIPVDPYTGEFFLLPKIDYPLEFDQRHTLNLNLDLMVPEVIPEPLRNLDLNLIARVGSGLPYTKRDSRNYIVGVTNSERMSWTWGVDMKLVKNFQLAGLKLSLIAEITNLFNTKNILNLYPNTGKPGDNEKLQDRITYLDQTWATLLGYAEADRIPVYDPERKPWEPGYHKYVAADERRDLNKDGFITQDEWYESYVRAYTDYMDDPYMYGDPRHINIGLSFSW